MCHSLPEGLIPPVIAGQLMAQVNLQVKAAVRSPSESEIKLYSAIRVFALVLVHCSTNYLPREVVSELATSELVSIFLSGPARPARSWSRYSP